MLKILTIGLLSIISFSSSFAEDSIFIIDDNQGKTDILDQVRYYYDEKREIEFSEVNTISGWKTLNNSGQKLFLNFYNAGDLWIQFSIRNNSSNNDYFIFEIPNATINHITFYKEKADHSFEIIETGASQPYKKRDLKTRVFSFDLRIPRGETRSYILKVNGEGDAINLPLRVYPPNLYIEQVVHERFLLGLYYGSLFFIIIFHLFLFYKLKDEAIIFYVLYVASFAGFQLYMDGYISKYVLPDFTFLAKRTPSMFAFLSLGSIGVFLQLYLKTKLYIPEYHRLLNLLKWICWTGFLLCLLPYHVYVVIQHFLNIFGPLFILFVLTGAFLCYKNQPKLARYFISALLFLVTGLVIEVVKNMGIGYFSDYGVKIGHAGEAIILAFALAVRFKLTNEETQALALERLENLNQLKDQYSSQLEDTVKKRTEELNISNNSIQDSIRYARHIQYSLLPSTKLLEDYLPDHFILYKPKDIVSGDFYWFEKIEKKIVIAVVDCTGHGVPGAFMSMLGSNILRDIVKTKGISNPGYILKNLDAEVKDALKQSSEDPLHKDGMDVCLISYDFEEKTLSFAGAKRPLIFISKNKEMFLFKGNKSSIGGEIFERSGLKEFISETIKIEKGDTVYLFTDGLVDQFGGEKDKKFLFSRFWNILKNIQNLTLKEQKEIIEGQFNDWRGNQEQVDDILVMGIKF